MKLTEFSELENNVARGFCQSLTSAVSATDKNHAYWSGMYRIGQC